MIYSNIKYHGTYCNNYSNTYTNMCYTTNEKGFNCDKRSYIYVLSFPYCGMFRQ